VETVQFIQRLTKSAMVCATAEGNDQPLAGALAIGFLSSILIPDGDDASSAGAASDAQAPQPLVLQAVVNTLCVILRIPGLEDFVPQLTLTCAARMCDQADSTLISADMFSLFGALSECEN
jgi:hypothetical protein